MKFIFSVEFKDEDLEFAINCYEEEMNKSISLEVDNVRKMILEGLRNYRAELTLINTQHLVKNKEVS